MPLAIPPELKKIAPFVKRAEELDRDKISAESRLVAYYCRQYAVHMGIPLANDSAAAKTCLGHLLEALEKEKPAMDTFTRDEAAFLCRKFATNIFDKADLEDREGQADKNTAKTYYAAASFLQILEQFEEEDSEQMEADRKQIVYAKWKATDILKALKEGRKPTPGGFGEEEEEKPKQDAPVVETVGEESGEEAEFHIPEAPKGPPTMPPSVPPPVMPPSVDPDTDDEPMAEDKEDDDDEEEADANQGQEVELGPPPAYPGPSPAKEESSLSFNLPPPMDVPMPKPAASPKKSSGGGLFGFGKKKDKVSKAELADATELTRFALAALTDKDVDLAAERLKQALSVLGR